MTKRKLAQRIHFNFASFQTTLTDLTLDYHHIYPQEWAPHPEAQTHYEVTRKISRWLPRKTPNSPRDDAIFYLMLVVTLFSANDRQMVLPSPLEAVQTQYLTMFHRYLRAWTHENEYGSAAKLLGEGMYVMSYVRQCFEVVEKNCGLEAAMAGLSCGDIFPKDSPCLVADTELLS